ncbi:MAG TPA: polyphosphate kinase 1 [Gaiellaceae bacterium]|nr:polyphosphate kinase 1 [Gaiellaceae bacterium]
MPDTDRPVPLSSAPVDSPELAELAVTEERPTGRFINREASWLDFDARILALADRRSRPVLDRARFFAIFSDNLDDFFQVRVGTLKMRLEARVTSSTEEEKTQDSLVKINERVRELVALRDASFAGRLVPDLAAAGIRLSDWDDLDAEDRVFLDELFDEQLFPVLTPLAVDPAHPFPYISNLSLNLAVVVRVPGELTRRLARVKVPQSLPRFVVLPDGERFVPLEQLIARHLNALFPGMEILEHSPFRVTRNTDFDIELEGEEDMVTAVESVLLRRRRSPIVVRLEVDSSMSEETLRLLMHELRLEENDVVRSNGLLALGGLWSIASLDRPDLKLEPLKPVTQTRLITAEDSGSPDLFAVIRDGDVLVQHPYDSFDSSVEAFIEGAARDPNVLAIKQTLYRTSADETGIMKALIRAAGEGKQVVCIVELKARFDEEANIGWAQQLEDAGVHVAYGVVGLKTHAKLCLAVRREGTQIRRYAHIGTGNYNRETAAIYEDLGLFTADPEITADVSEVFNLLTGYSRQQEFRTLLVAPSGLRARLLELIQAQSRPAGHITMKLNSLVDHEVIDALYDASRAGARIELVVRGMCCLRPGVPGLSEGITVRSIVGRFLEHSRVFRFGTGPEATYLLGSADLMERNLDRRVEVLTPIRDQALRARLDEILGVLLADEALAWTLDGDGIWHEPEAPRSVDAQTRLEEAARAGARPVVAV